VTASTVISIALITQPEIFKLKADDDEVADEYVILREDRSDDRFLSDDRLKWALNAMRKRERGPSLIDAAAPKRKRFSAAKSSIRERYPSLATMQTRSRPVDPLADGKLTGVELTKPNYLDDPSTLLLPPEAMIADLADDLYLPDDEGCVHTDDSDKTAEEQDR
jgi:hypothetical protein